MLLDQFSLQLELDDRDRLVHLLVELGILHIVLILVILHLERLARIVVIRHHGKARQRHEIDAVAILQNIKIAVFCGDAQHIRNTCLIARSRAHPQHIMVAPLDIHGMIFHQCIHDQMRVRPAVKNIPDHMQVIHDQTADQVAQGNDQLRRTAGLDHGIDDLVIIILLI